VYSHAQGTTAELSSCRCTPPLAGDAGFTVSHEAHEMAAPRNAPVVGEHVRVTGAP
jgi:hypothetical protein